MPILNLNWVGGNPPFNIIHNLSRLAGMLESQKEENGLFCPCLCIDRQALGLLIQNKTLNESMCSVIQEPSIGFDQQLLQDIKNIIEPYSENLSNLNGKMQFLQMNKELVINGTEKMYLPIVIWEDLEFALKGQLLKSLSEEEVNNIFSIINFARNMEHKLPIPQVASDIIRILQLLAFPGSMYVDITDVGLKRLPTADDIPTKAKIACRMVTDMERDEDNPDEYITRIIQENDILYVDDQDYLIQILKCIAQRFDKRPLNLEKYYEAVIRQAEEPLNLPCFGKSSIKGYQIRVNNFCALLIFDSKIRKDFLEIIDECSKQPPFPFEEIDFFYECYGGISLNIMNIIRLTLQELIGELSFGAFSHITAQAYATYKKGSFYGLRPTGDGKLEREVFTEQALVGKSFSSWKMPGESLLHLVQFCDDEINKEGRLAVHSMCELYKIYKKYLPFIKDIKRDDIGEKATIKFEEMKQKIQPLLRSSITLSLYSYKTSTLTLPSGGEASSSSSRTELKKDDSEDAGQVCKTLCATPTPRV